MHRQILLIVFVLVQCTTGFSQPNQHTIPRLENPITVDYLKKNLAKTSPRLVLNPENEKLLREKLTTDAVVGNMYQAIKLNAEKILESPLLERKVIGRRLLRTSREFLYRMNMLGMVYRIDKSNEVLDRIDREVRKVCSFSDWNPSHYLDVAEMALGVALAVDWTAEDLADSTREIALNALIEKGIKPSWQGKTPGWVDGTNNWNQVCNGGMIAASIAVAEVAPELAAKTINRALDGLPYSLVEYGPDGVYPEGSTYWSYGTSYSVITIAMLESAFGKDFGMSDYPAFKESAVFRIMCNAPSGWYYNFADCGDQRGSNGDLTLAWFATKTGNGVFFERDRFLRKPEDMGKLTRLAGASLVWLAQYQPSENGAVPRAWKGEGANPVVIFTGGDQDPNQYYFGGKGGRGMVNHGNMDAGSFIFELNSVRWVIDPGNQAYHELEKTGFNLWGRCQNCQRWTLLTKNNFGHSTLTINDSLHRVEGLVELERFQGGENPEATFNMTPAFGELIASASRTFSKQGDKRLLVEDHIVLNENTSTITWQLLTQAEVEPKKGGMVLRQAGKELQVNNLSDPELTPKVVDLDPPPLELDRRIENLKRVEFRYTAEMFDEGQGRIRIELLGR